MTRIKYKPKVRKVLWRTGRVIEDAAGMATLRKLAYRRSGGFCECKLVDPNRVCRLRVSYNDGHLHHLISRARGGSDVIENVAFLERICHREIHGEPKWSRPGWIA